MWNETFTVLTSTWNKHVNNENYSIQQIEVMKEYRSSIMKLFFDTNIKFMKSFTKKHYKLGENGDPLDVIDHIFTNYSSVLPLFRNNKSQNYVLVNSEDVQTFSVQRYFEENVVISTSPLLLFISIHSLLMPEGTSKTVKQL
jgi:hypothetical protein